MGTAILFFQLVIGHAAGDFVLQPGPMSSGKIKQNNLKEQYGESFPPWYYWLTAHALTHAGIVYFITGNPAFALIEAFSHWAIDYFKCEKRINLHQDQVLHILFKAGYCIYYLL